MGERRERHKLKPGNQAALKHGGERAIKHLQHGTPLVGIAAELKRQVAQEIEEHGIVAVMRERAERHQAVADLFYGLLLGTTDEEPLDRATKRFGWLNAKAFTMLREIAELEKQEGAQTLAELLATPVVKGGDDGRDA